MMLQGIWQLQDAKSKFSELVDSAIHSGPQFVTRRGIKSVVVLSIDEFNRLQRHREDLLSFFLAAPKVELDLERSKDSDRQIFL